MNRTPVIPHDDIRQQKQLLRRLVRQEVSRLDDAYCRTADAAIRSALFSLPDYRSAAHIFCFVSRPTEVDTRPVLEDILAAGKTLAVPRCSGKGIMQAHVITDPKADLAPGNYGIWEPSADLPVILPEDLDLILLPCCTCSHTGKRLGFGGGYYDRFLAHTKARTIALCREAIVKDDIPTDAFDLPVDIVLTETGVFPA